MRLTRISFNYFLVALALAGLRAFSQANVTENQTTLIYVDAQKGSDGNAGSITAPLKTIQAAVNKANTNNQKKIGTKVIVNPGIYRETVNIMPVSNQSTVPLSVQAASTGTAIIAGSDVLKNWSTDPSYPSAYITTWFPVMGTCSVPSGWPSNFGAIALKTEMIFVNGVPLTQVLGFSQMQPGTFYINETYGTLHVWPAAGTNMATAVVEAATRQKTLSIVGRSNIVLRGLVLRHAASCINTSGATVTSTGAALFCANAVEAQASENTAANAPKFRHEIRRLAVIFPALLDKPGPPLSSGACAAAIGEKLGTTQALPS